MPMPPVLLDTGTRHERHYACRGGGCTRPYILAEAVEAAVWAHLVWLNEAVAAGVATDKRRAMVRSLLRAVRVGDDIGDMGYEWRD
jgi:hypothetical protein